MTTRSYYSFLIVALILVFLVSIQIIPAFGSQPAEAPLHFEPIQSKNNKPIAIPIATQQPQETGLGDVYLPYVVFIWPPTPTPTNTPQLALLYVENQTGGVLCYEVLGTGIGEKCFPEGKHFYGSFPPGTYEWKASASCGSDSGSRYFWEGESTHMFWCSMASLSSCDR